MKRETQQDFPSAAVPFKSSENSQNSKISLNMKFGTCISKQISN